MSERSQELASLGYPLEVTIRYGSVEKKITGAPEDVAKAVLSFLTSLIPQLELASLLVLSVDLSKLAKACEGIVAITPEGVVLTVSTEGLADRELILLHLAKEKIAEMTGKSKSDTVQRLISLQQRSGRAEQWPDDSASYALKAWRKGKARANIT